MAKDFTYITVSITIYEFILINYEIFVTVTVYDN